MKYSDVKSLLTETSASMKKQGVDMFTDYQQILSDEHLFEWYKESLAEGLDGSLREEFLQLSDNVRDGMLMETVYGFKPQSQLVMPIFRKVWPQLVAREALTVMPMDKPEIVHAFMIAYAQLGDGSEVALPNLTTPVSTGTEYSVTAPLSITMGATNVLTANSLTSSVAHLQHDWVVLSVVWTEDTTANPLVTHTVSINSEPDDEGNIAFEVECGANDDFVQLNIDYYTGIITATHTRAGETKNVVTAINLIGSISGAEEMYANKIVFKHNKIYLKATDHEIQAEWSIQYEQDVKAYFDLNVQAQLVDTFGNAVAMDIDRKLLNSLINQASLFHSDACQTFYKLPPDSFAFGRKMWYNEIVVPLNNISSQIYTDTNIDMANIIITNPNDAAILKSTNDYSFKGDVKGGGLGDSPVAGTFNEQWKVLVTPLMPANKMLVMLKPDNPDLAVYVFAPYRPLTITPWPLGRKPAMSFLSRYATQCIRREGLGLLTLSATQDPMSA